MDSGFLVKNLGCMSGSQGRNGFECSEYGDKALQNSWTEGEEVELAFAAHMDEAGGFELLDVMRKSCSSDGQGGERLRASQRAAGFGNAFEQRESARIGQGLEQCGAAGFWGAGTGILVPILG